jgi:outer membrane protein assembly factor BamB
MVRYEVNMTSLTIVSARTSKQVCLLGTAILFLTGFCFSQPAISLSPSSGPPTTNLRVSGSGFAPNAKIDIYFGTQDEAVAMTNGSGSFSQIAIPAPASALPGAHWVSAVERSGHSGAQATFLVSTSWKQFHRHNMVRWNQYENVLNVNNVGSLQVKWSYATGGAVESSPAVWNGVVYVGSDDNNVYALKASTGAKLWSYLTGNYVISSPAVENGVVYAGSEDGNVFALNASTGALLWSYLPFPGESVLSSPTIVNGVVYVGTTEGSVFALNASTGAPLWSYQTGYFVNSSPAVANGVVYVSSYDNNVYALKASTGAKLWSYAIYNNVTDSSPAVVDGVVYVGSAGSYLTGSLYALKASTGALLWSYPTASRVYSSPAVANVCAQCPHRRPAVELPDNRGGGFPLPRRGEWGGLCRVVRRQSLRLRPEAGFGASWGSFQTSQPEDASPRLQPQGVPAGGNSSGRALVQRRNAKPLPPAQEMERVRFFVGDLQADKLDC